MAKEKFWLNENDYFVKAIVAILNFPIFADSKVCPHASKVAPVVITSSTNKICFPLISAGFVIENISCIFSKRLYLLFLVCVADRFVRRRLTELIGTSSTEEMPSAIHML
ncbi:hypothetical protein D3C86_1850550 [compost metagenome]